MTSKQRYTPDHAVNLRIASDVQVSPDGRHVAFTVAPIGHKETKPTSAIWLAPVEDGEAREFTMGAVVGHEDKMPRWSPDSRTLGFLSDRAERGAHQIHLIDLDGGEARPLTSVPKGLDLLAWAPDGRSLTATADRRALAGEDKPATEVRVASTEARPRVIVRVPVEGGPVRVLGPAEGHVWAYAWSADGRSVAALTTPGNGLDEPARGVRLLVIDPVTRAERVLTTLDNLPATLQWSPDGSRLVAVANVPGSADDTRVLLIDAESGAIETLEAGATTPLWAGWLSGQEPRLLTLAEEGLYNRIDLVHLGDDTRQQLAPLPPGGAAQAPLSVSADGGTLACIRTHPAGPPEVWAGPIDGELRCLTHLNPQLDDVAIAPMEPVEWTASDGLTIQGWLLRPPGTEPGERLPLIVQVHGGPTSRWGPTFHGTWHDWGQIFAAAGYAVLLPNPRGSTGRGAEFTASNRGDLGGMDFDDVMRGVDWAIEQGIADPDRLGIAGWSYGGFLTAWAITHTDRFKAAVAGAAVTNWPSKVGTTDIRPYNEARFPGPLHEAPDAYWERSPIRYLGRVTTPTLVVHGEADVRVPPEQGMELYLGLRAAGVPTDFITYPRQGHAFHERAFQRDLLQRLVAWFDRWMGK